jgi:hypothetical protein
MSAAKSPDGLKALKNDKRAIFSPAHAQRAADYLHGMPPATQEARAPYGGRQGVLGYSSFGERRRTAGRSGRLSFREREALAWLQFFITKSVNVMHLHRLVAS